MSKRHVVPALLLLVVGLLVVAPAYAQQTTGNIVGRVLDEQKSAVPGATVTATNPATGFKRAATSDAEGMYRFTALPIGSYDLVIELTGFATVDRKGIQVSVGQTLSVDIDLKIAKMAETVTVTGETPLVETTSSSVGGVVDVTKIEALPLNGRQFANLAMTIPGVGMGFHSDPTKSTQYSPQIGGGNGRNVNYQIDGGDNNDDTVGGLLQLFPLEAIQEFNMVTQRYKAEYGRSNGGVMSIVTRGGTNQFKGSWFTLGRDKSLNAQTETEKLNDIDKQYYRRYQFGGSFGGPIVQNKVHFFAAGERTQQDTKQAVNTSGLFPDRDGIYNVGYRENLLTGKVTANVTTNQYLSVRYGRNSNAQPYNAGPQSPPDNWGDSANAFNSINLNHNWILGGSKLNEFIFQYADFTNHITARSNLPQESFPNGVRVGQDTNTPQTTIQHKFQFRDDFSWHKGGGWGLGHDFRTGMNIIYEPRLYVTFNTGTMAYSYTHQTNDINGPITAVSKNGGDSTANIPTKQFGMYFQDDWRVRDRLTLNLGLRYDVNTGFAINQSKNPNFVKLQDAGAAGKLAGFIGFEDFGLAPREDYNNIQPRVGLAYDVHGDGKDVLRGGWGIYYDFGYTNANILFAAINASGIGAGQVFSVSNSNGIKNANGTFFKVSDPIGNIASQNEITGPPMGSHVASPRILQPYTQQTSAGWSHELSPTTVVDIDYVHINGHDLGLRWQLNTRVGGTSGPRRLNDLVPGLNPPNVTLDISQGYSRFDSINIGIRRRMDRRVQFNAWYSLASAKGTGGNGGDELTNQWVQDATNPFAPVQFGPSGRTDSRHRITVSAVIEAPGRVNVSPIFRFRSALPLNITYGYDNNQNGANNDIFTEAYAFAGLDAAGNPKLQLLGDCPTINCGRGTNQSVFNLRVSRVFALGGRAHLEAIAEVFNLFNALNPGNFIGSYYTGSKSSHSLNPNFLRPNSFAGDFQMPEQRVGQIGFRFTF
jgi:outer membrane receptor protein involved in Fe transport